MSKLAKKLEWLVIVYDNAINQRLAFRAEHLLQVPAKVAAGVITGCGPIFKDASKKEFLGSSFTMLAESELEVLEILKKDIYAEKNVWNLSDVVIHPYQPFYRGLHELPKEN